MNVLTALKSATLGKIDELTALRAIDKREAGARVTDAQIIEIASDMSPLVKLTQVTDVKLASPKRNPKTAGRHIVKMAHTVCILPENAEFYTSSIVNTAKQNKDNDAANIEAYKPQESKYDHNAQAFAACTLKSDSSKHYLYTIQDRCTKSVFVDADTRKVMTREEVAELCTPSEAKKLLGQSEEKTNKSFDIQHDVVVRIIKQENVISMEKVDF